MLYKIAPRAIALRICVYCASSALFGHALLYIATSMDGGNLVRIYEVLTRYTIAVPEVTVIGDSIFSHAAKLFCLALFLCAQMSVVAELIYFWKIGAVRTIYRRIQKSMRLPGRKVAERLVRVTPSIALVFGCFMFETHSSLSFFVEGLKYADGTDERAYVVTAAALLFIKFALLLGTFNVATRALGNRWKYW